MITFFKKEMALFIEKLNDGNFGLKAGVHLNEGYVIDFIRAHDKRLIDMVIEKVKNHERTNTYDDDEKILFYFTVSEIVYLLETLKREL